MAITAYKTWIAGEVLFASDLNSSISRIIDNLDGTATSPRATALDMNGLELILDADGDTSITADTDDQIDVKIGGSDVFAFTGSAPFLTIMGKGVLTSADRKVIDAAVARVSDIEQRVGAQETNAPLATQVFS